MARKRTFAPLGVFLNGRRVGTLSRQATGAIDFAYDPDWLAWEHALPVSRSLPLREDRYVGEGVIAVFENLLPENDAIRRRVAERTGAAGTDAYSLLSEIGRDCVGALQFAPDGAEPGPPGRIEGEALSEKEIADLIRNLERAPLGIEDDEFRISIAGAQEKTALLFHDGVWKRPRGATATTHIFKPPIGKLPSGLDMSLSVENEYLCMKLIAALGLPGADAKMESFEDQKVLVVERFDRRWTKDGRLLRLPQEDCCQALGVPPTRKYESQGGPGIRAILELLKESDAPGADQALFLKAQMVFWMIGATDGHAKNFSVFMAPGGRFRMTPLYDVLSVIPNFAARQIQKNKMKLAMAVGDSRHYGLSGIASRHFIETAKSAGMGAQITEDLLHELAASIPGAIRKTEEKLPKGFPAMIAEPIFSALQRHAAADA